jgi:hypothetical protein
VRLPRTELAIVAVYEAMDMAEQAGTMVGVVGDE